MGEMIHGRKTQALRMKRNTLNCTNQMKKLGFKDVSSFLFTAPPVDRYIFRSILFRYPHTYYK